MSYATHCIPWDQQCTICNPQGYADGDEVSLSLLATMHDTGKACAECFAEFTAANGQPSCCETCKNMGSELPVSQHPEVNREAHKTLARKRRKAKENR